MSLIVASVEGENVWMVSDAAISDPKYPLRCVATFQRSKSPRIGPHWWDLQGTMPTAQRGSRAPDSADEKKNSYEP
jgi:hypothetical protein